MCGIVGYLDKRGGERPVGAVLRAMLKALGCRGPDSAGVALFGNEELTWTLHIPIETLQAERAEVQRLLRPLASAIREAYLTLSVEPAADAVAFERRLLESIPRAEIVSL